MKAKFVHEALINERDLASIDPLIKNKIKQLLAVDADYNDQSIQSLKLTPMGIEFNCWLSPEYANYLKILVNKLGLDKFLTGEPILDKMKKVYIMEWKPEYKYLVNKPMFVKYDYARDVVIDAHTKQVFEQLKRKGWQK